jgi:biopolymer transport protein ExbB
MSAFFKFVTGDWYFAIPMFLMSFAGITLVIWRILLNLNAKTNMSAFLPLFQEKLEKEGVEGALRFCRAQSGLIPRRVFATGLQVSRQGAAAMKRAMTNEIELEVLPQLKFLLAPILAIAKIATMVGLFVTVLSMIGTFSAIQGAAAGEMTSYAGAIGLALFGTAMGLITAIPLVFAHVLFVDWVGKFELKMKAAAQKLLLLMQTAKQPGAAGAAAKPAAVAGS